MNYEEMSDFEINKKVLLRLGKELHHIQSEDNQHGAVNLRLLNNGCMVVNYCNNATDAWPIIQENSIALLPTGKFTVWCAIAEPNIDRNNQIHANILEYDSNPLRAAMICFLKMKDDQQ